MTGWGLSVALAAALLAMLPLPGHARSQAQSQDAPDCRDDDGEDRCDAAVQARVRALFDLPAIEALAGDNVQIIRAFFVDGYGSDMPAISYERRLGEGPRVRVYGGKDARGQPRVMTAPVPLAIWDKLLDQAMYFDRRFAPVPKPPTDEIVLCMHAWVATVESTGVATRKDNSGIARTTQDACDEGLAMRFAFAMAEQAGALLPGCAELDRAQHRNAVALLGACLELEGDRPAAALAMNRYERDGFADPGIAERASSIAYLFDDQARIEWAGEAPVTGMMAAARFWTAKSAANQRFWSRRVIGETADRVRMIGMVEAYRNGAAEPRYAEAEQLWTRENGSDFRLREMKVGVFTASAPQ